MRRIVVPLLALFLVASSVAIASAAKPVKLGLGKAVSHATGEITALDPTRITVAHVSCSIPSTVTGIGRFVIGDPVTMTCGAGSLKTIKYSPPSTPQTDVPSSVPQRATPTSTSAASNPGIVKTPISQSSATGAITAFDAAGITVGGVTCPTGTAFFDHLNQALTVGMSVSMTCNTFDDGLQTTLVTGNSRSG